MTTPINSNTLPLITNFAALDITTRTFTPVGDTVGTRSTLVVGGRARASLQNCILAIGYKAYQNNEAAIASQLTQIQSQNQDSKLAAAILEAINRLEPQTVGPSGSTETAVTAARIYAAALGAIPETSRGANNANVAGIIERVIGSAIPNDTQTWYSQTEMDGFVNKISQYQQNATTQNTVLQEQLVIYNNHRQTIMSFMTNIMTAFDKASKSLLRSI